MEAEGRLEDAAKLYLQILSSSPNFGVAHHNLSRVLRFLGHPSDALHHAETASKLLADVPAAHHSYGVSLEQMGFIDDALEAYKKAIALDPLHVPSASNRGRLLDQQGDSRGAVELMAPAYAHEPDEIGISINLANAYLGCGRPEDALELLQDTALKDQRSEIIHNSVGTAYYIMNEWREAEAAFRRAIDCAPDFAEAHENLAQTLFQLGCYSSGWAEYEWRWKNPSNQLTKLPLNSPLWDGSQLDGKIILLRAEQGYGDTLQFVRYAPLVAASGGTVALVCQKELIRLLEGAPGLHHISSLDDGIPEHDVHAPLLSLPRILGQESPFIPHIMPYLSAQPAILSNLPAGDENIRTRIGIVWAGRQRHIQDPYRNRSCDINNFDEIIQMSGVACYSLQTGNMSQNSNNWAENDEIIDLSAQITDFADTAALLQALDLIITIDTATAHLAGAMGKPCFLLLARCADWRWREDRGKNPWYPSIRAFRQPNPGDWKSVFESVKRELEKLHL
ncbi:MAG: glycosyltransferase family protein [Rhodospirillales bacterium]|nr:glycosyltransferase family protein [Rhodospirillales bacterium]